ncbi:MAG: NYN domain-containing protein [Phormidesmis sp.]
MADKVAIFLDVENLSGWLKANGGRILLERSTELGQVAVCRAYGDFSSPTVNTRQTDLNPLGFEFVHAYHPVSGKNSADIQIVVDVMDYVARIPDLKWVVLATGDSDFSPLFRRLRELGKSVIGVGPKSVLSETVQKSCNQFIYTDSLARASNAASTAAKNTAKTASSKSTQPRKAALKLLASALKQLPEGADLSAVKKKMVEMDAAFDHSTLGFKGFKKFLQSAPEVVTLYERNNAWHAKAAITATSTASNP